MKVPLNWLKDYVKVPAIQDLTDQLTMAGHMLDGVSTHKNGKVIDLELRGNRADCYSILGIAREIAAIYNTVVKVPPTANLKKSKLKEVSLKVESPNVNRVMMAIVKNVKIMPSPAWLKDNLEAYGVDSINNIVDLTNYVAIELGEPMHAFDLDKIGKKLSIRQAKKNEKMLTFQDKILTLTEDDLVWANNEGVLSVAGAIGGKKHSIHENTQNILVEAASYNQANIRRSVHRLNLYTEAGIRHEKNLDPEIVEDGISRFLYLVKKHNWGTVAQSASDYYKKPVKSWSIKLNLENLNLVSGFEIQREKTKNILKRLGFSVTKEDKYSITLGVPTHRTDVTVEADVIEEVVRIIGYDKIPTKIISGGVPEDITPNFIKQEIKLRQTLESLGFDEIISLSFVKEGSQELNKTRNINHSIVNLENPPSPDFMNMRATLLPNLLDAACKAKNERVFEVYYFEIGKVYTKTRSKLEEKRKLGLLYFGGTYANFKGRLEALFDKIGIHASFEASDDFTTLRKAYIISRENKEIGHGGERNDMFFAEIDLDSILANIAATKVNLWPKYPPQIEDITLQLPPKTKVGTVVQAIRNILYVQKAELRDTYKDSFTFRIWYQSRSKTLTDKEVEAVREKILNEVGNKFGGVMKN